MRGNQFSPLLLQQFLIGPRALDHFVGHFLEILVPEAFDEIELVLEYDYRGESGLCAVEGLPCDKLAHLPYPFEQWLHHFQIAVEGKHLKRAVEGVLRCVLGVLGGMQGVVKGGVGLLGGTVALVVDGEPAAVGPGDDCGVVLAEMVLIFVIFLSQHLPITIMIIGTMF